MPSARCPHVPVIILLSAVVALAGAPTAAATEPGPANPAAPAERAIAEDMLRRLNDERARRGRHPLAWDRELATAAAVWSEEMARSGKRHSSRAQWQASPWGLLQFSRWGETIYHGWGAAYASGASAHWAWMRSDAHRLELLWAGWDAVGLGVACDGTERILVTAMFSTHHGSRRDRAPRPSRATPPANPVMHPTRSGASCASPPGPVRQDHQHRRVAGRDRWEAVEAQPTAARTMGATRYATAAALALRGWDRSGRVLVASGVGFADALAGGYLGGAWNAPVLLSDPRTLPAEVRQALRELGAEEAVILGGEDAVGPGVAAALADLGLRVRRIAGEHRIDTAARIATAAQDRVGSLDGDRTAVLAAADGWADALVATSVAAAQHFPIVLTDAHRLHPRSLQALEELRIRRVLVAGGPAAVSEEVVGALRQAGFVPERVAGARRTATAVAFAELATQRLGWSPDGMTLATAADYADALTAAGLAARQRRPLLLTLSAHQLGGDAEDWLRARACQVGQHVQLVGGEQALTRDVAYLVEQAATCLP